jgi:hypothetical protein
MGFLSRNGMSDLLAVAAHQLTDKIASLISRNQLTQNRADGRFKGIPPPGQPQTRKTIIEL